MSPEPDDSSKTIEESILEDMRTAYSEKVIDHALNPRNIGEFKDADGFGRMTGPCGDTIQICLKVKDGMIAYATIMIDGCVATIACGSMTTELVKGKTIAEAFRITSDDILNSLDGLPESNTHCALLAANTLKKALEDYLSIQKEPWKKSYRRIEPLRSGE